MRVNEHIRYGPDEPCPLPLALGVAVQYVVLALPPTVLVVILTVRATGQDDGYLTWAVFAAFIINAVVTTIQAVRLWRLGCGLTVVTGPTIQFVAITAAAVSEGGPALLATLLVVSSLFQFAVAAWLPLMRRIITPVVSGTVLMLVAVTIAPVVFERLADVSEGRSQASGPVVAAVTLAVSAALTLRASGMWRVWSALISIGVGCVVAAVFGIYDYQRVIDAPWFGIPDLQFPGLDLMFGLEFWTLLPTFIVLTLVLAIKGISDSVIIQNASQRRQRAIDFRQVQGAVGANSVGMLLAGIAGTPPTMAFSSFGSSLIGLTGVAARRVGFAIAAVFVFLALLPKFAALLLTVPDPVMGAYLLLLLGLFFVGGLQTAMQDGLDQGKVLVIGLSFAVGIGMQHLNVVELVLGPSWGSLLGNPIVSGLVVAVLLTAFVEFSGRRGKRLEVALDDSTLPAIDAFMVDVAAGMRWNESSTMRLRSAGEEAVTSLMPLSKSDSADRTPWLHVSARPGAGVAELEFVASVIGRENLQDRLAYLEAQPAVADPGELSFRLLRHYASGVQHRQYYGIDVVTIRVEGSP